MDVFPVTSFPVTALRWRPVGMTIGGGPTFTGPGQEGEFSGGGWWVAELNEMDLGDEQAIRALRSLIWRAKKLKRFVVPMLDWPLSPALASVPHGDGSPFSDSSEYVGGGVEATLAASAVHRATQVSITLNPETAGPLQGGEVFTLVDAEMGPRLHGIDEILDVDGDTFTCSILPPLRAGFDLGAEVDFNTPRCVMRLDDPQDEATPWITAGWEGKSSLRFVEAFDRLEVEEA